MEDMTKEEVFGAIKDSKNRKAVGPDGIPAEFWKMMKIHCSVSCYVVIKCLVMAMMT